MQGLVCLLCLVFAGCVLGGKPPAVPDVPAVPPIVVAPVPPLPEVHPTPAPPPEPVFTFSLGAAPALPPSAEAPKAVPLKASAKEPRQAGPQSAAQLIDEANRSARLAPTARGYFGGGGTYRYQWTAGRIYEIYLSPASGTKISISPGKCWPTSSY